MTVEVLYFPGCPHYLPTVQRVREVLDQERIVATTSELQVADATIASRIGFLGSPSVRVNGADVEPSARGVRDYGLMCRIYIVDGRREGLPSREMIRLAIRGAGKPPAE